MNIKRFVDALIGRWWLILILALLGGIAGELKVEYSPSMYKATTTLYMMNRDKIIIQNQPLETKDIELSQQLLQQYYDIIYSRTVVSAVLQNLWQYNLTENELYKILSFNSKQESNVFAISATSENPVLSADVANSMAKTFSSTIRQLSNSDNVGILDEAVAPVVPEPDHRLAIILLGILAGIVVAFSIIYIIEYFDTTVRSEKDIAERLKLRVVGIIPEYKIR